jgi:DNA-binding NarL/FixJ family response regulator
MTEPISAAKTRIVLIEGHAILRDGLRALLELENDLAVVGSVGEAAGALRIVEDMQPDLVICDVSLPDRSGVGLISELLLTFRRLRLLVLTAHGSEEYIRAALNAGAHGYVVKHSGQADLLRAIRVVMSGRQYLCASVAEKVVSGFVSGYESRRTTPVEELMTGRERQILTCVALGQSNKKIARDLGLSVKTVEKHRANLMRKLTLRNAAGVTLFALRHGFIEANTIDPGSPHSPSR